MYLQNSLYCAIKGETSDNDDISRPAKKLRWDENRYHCDECMFKTCRPGRLKSHMESKHPLISQRIWEEDLHEEQEEEVKQFNIVLFKNIKQLKQRIMDLFFYLFLFLYIHIYTYVLIYKYTYIIGSVTSL